MNYIFVREKRPLYSVNRRQALTLNCIYDIRDFYWSNPGAKERLQEIVAKMPANEYIKNDVLLNLDKYDIVGIRGDGITTNDIYVQYKSERDLNEKEVKEMNDIFFSSCDMRDELYNLLERDGAIYNENGHIIGYKLNGGRKVGLRRKSRRGGGSSRIRRRNATRRRNTK
jgi:hypothetical protein